MMFTTLLTAGLCIASLSLAAPRDRPNSISHPGALARRGNDLDSLVLIIKAQDDINDPDDLTVSACVLNNGNTTLKILNDPNGPLSTWKTHTFEFYKRPDTNSSSLKARADGLVAAVDTVRVKYNPELAAALSNPDAYTILQPGQNKTVVHNLSGMYQFYTAGAYAVRAISKAETFLIVNNDSSIGYIQAKIYDGPEATSWTATKVSNSGIYASVHGLVDAGIPKQPAARRWKKDDRIHSRSVTFRGCSAAQQKSVIVGINGANTYLNEVSKFFRLGSHQGSKRYQTWFGSYTEERWNKVRSHFFALQGQPADFQYDCSCNEKDTFAYVYPNQFGTVYLCPMFWSAPVQGKDSKAGTIIHEATHFTKLAGTTDYKYGHTEAAALAKADPGKAVMNADSHEYFAENTPKIA